MQLEWSDLAYDDVRRSMVYWYGWNKMVAERRLKHLYGYNASMGTQYIGNDYVVRLEDPSMLEKLTTKLGLPPAIVQRAKTTAMTNGGGGTSSEADKKAFGMVSWSMMEDAAPLLARKIYDLARSYVAVAPLFDRECRPRVSNSVHTPSRCYVAQVRLLPE